MDNQKNAVEALENQDIVIFKAGTHKSSEGKELVFSESDLDKIVENTDIEKVANVVHHPKVTSYSLAKFSQLKRVGKNLVARLKDINKSFANAIKDGFLPSRSIRITDNKIEHLGWLPIGVKPAVEGMPDVQFSKEDGGFIFFDFNMDNKDLNFKTNCNKNKKEDFSMDKEFFQKLSDENIALKLEIETMKKGKADFEASQNDLIAKKDEEIKNLTEKVESLEKSIEKTKTDSFSALIETKLKEVSTDEMKKEIKPKLEGMAKRYDEVKDFEEALELMNFDSKKKAPEKEDFSKGGKEDEQADKAVENL